MKKIMGEYKTSLKKLFNSFRKKFELDYGETLEEVDKIISDKDYAVLYFSSDISYSKELIEEINSSGVGKAYGFYKDGPITKVEELKEAIPRVIEAGGSKFVFVEIEERSRFRLEELPKTVFIKQGRKEGNIALDIVKSREYISDEVIRKISTKDLEGFNKLYNKLYMARWEQRNDIFVKNFKMLNSELTRMCSKSDDLGAFVCYRENKLVGFIVYETLREKDHRSYIENYYLTVRDIYVVEEFRRRGIATRLFREIKRMADKNCIKYVRFKAWAFDESILGFVQSLGKRDLYMMYEIDV